MQVETLLILNTNKEILYYSHCFNESKDWNEYIDRLVKLLPTINDKLPSFLIFDDIVIGTLLMGSLVVVLTAPTTSNFVIENLMNSAIKQIKKIISHVCKNEGVSQSNLMQRDHYIFLKLLLQAEISGQGYMHFIKSDDFDSYNF